MPELSLDHCIAIVTGASSGLGSEFARQLAPQADGLLLAARRMDALEALKAELLARHPALSVHCCACDLATDEGRALLIEAVKPLPTAPNVLINNAGMGDYGSLLSADAARLKAQIELNISAVVLLTHGLAPVLRATPERAAGILNVSSLAGTLPMPDLAVYAASKAFVTSFSEALRVELAPRNIVVSALCPGPTPTNFSKTARRSDGGDTDRSGQGLLRMLPQEVVRQGLEALQQNRATVYPGLGVRVAGTLFRLLPRVVMRYLLQLRHQRAQTPS